VLDLRRRLITITTKMEGGFQKEKHSGGKADSTWRLYRERTSVRRCSRALHRWVSVVRCCKCNIMTIPEVGNLFLNVATGVENEK
jgi:hypothetical protein